MISQVPFLYRGKALITLPLLAGYTTTLPAAISDTGLVVGRAGKPGPLGQKSVSPQPSLHLGRSEGHPWAWRFEGRLGLVRLWRYS